MTEDMVAAWLIHLQMDRNLSPNTLRTYARTLRTFPNAMEATPDDVEAWWRERAPFLTATSRNNELAALRSFYRWAVRWQHRPDDPTVRIDALKVDKGLPRPISRADLWRVLDADTTDDVVRRAVCLGAWAGLRISEAAALGWDDVDDETRRLRVLGKGRKTRLVGCSAMLLDSLLPRVDGANVVTGTARAYAPGTLDRRVNRAMKAAGVDATFHQLRHRFGTVALAASGNLLAVSRAMGHENPATTAIYTATSDADLDVIADAVTR